MKLSYKLIFWMVLATLPLSASLRAQMPAEEITRIMGRLNEVRGTSGILTASVAVLEFYPDLNESFDSGLSKATRAHRTIERYNEDTLNSAVAWSEYLQAFQEIQGGREEYQDALRAKIAKRTAVIDRLINGGLLRSLSNQNVSRKNEQAIELGALIKVQNQISRQSKKIAAGQAPVIDWPEELNADLRKELQETIATLVKNSETRPDVVRLLEARIARIRTDLEAASDWMLKIFESRSEQMSALEQQAIAEVTLLTEAQIDLATNALLEQSIIRASLIAQNTYTAWEQIQQGVGDGQ